MFLLSLGIGQSFFNKVVGNEEGFQSARSYAIGQTHFMNSNTSTMALRNPAKLGFIQEGIKLDFNISGFMYNERRSINLQDYFEDFLTEGDYVFDNNFYNYNQFGILANYEIFFMNFGFSFSHGPWSSLDYRYEEEVRGSASFDDGIIGIRDPLVGYHILEHNGQIDLTSFGLGVGINERISLGLGINSLHDGSYNYLMKSIQIGESLENLAPIIDSNGAINFDGDIFASISGIFKTSGLEFSIGYEQSAEIKDNSGILYPILSDISGLPLYVLPIFINEQGVLDYIDPSNPSEFTNQDFTLSYLEHLYIEKPEKFKIGFNHQEGSNVNYRLFSLEIIKNTFENIFYKDYYKINLGIEYVKHNRVLRSGISYKQSSFQTSYLSPLTTFSFGTSKTVNKLNFDISASYSYQKYKYHDLFPVQDDVRPDFDNVHESNWSLISTISYTF